MNLVKELINHLFGSDCSSIQIFELLESSFWTHEVLLQAQLRGEVAVGVTFS